MKIMIKIKNEPYSRVYENVTSIHDNNGATCILHEFQGFKDKEEIFINDLIEILEVL